MSVINLTVLIISSVMLMACPDWVMAMHANISASGKTGSLYFRFLAYYKVVVIAQPRAILCIEDHCLATLGLLSSVLSVSESPFRCGDVGSDGVPR